MLTKDGSHEILNTQTPNLVEKPKNSTKQVKQKKNYGYQTAKTKLIKNELVRMTKAAFADIFQAWTHLKALRIFVESVLRYGLPPEFISAVIKVCLLLNCAELSLNGNQWLRYGRSWIRCIVI